MGQGRLLDEAGDAGWQVIERLWEGGFSHLQGPGACDIDRLATTPSRSHEQL
jgi:hypothetical protein